MDGIGCYLILICNIKSDKMDHNLIQKFNKFITKYVLVKLIYQLE